MALIKVAIGIAKKIPQKPNNPPKTNTASIIITGCNLTASENSKGANKLPSNICNNTYAPINNQKSKVRPNCNKPTAATGIVAANAPMYGISTENPTKTDKRAMYCNPKNIKIIAEAQPTIRISIALPLV